MFTNAPRIAVLIPCYNEAAAIAEVVTSFRAALPTAQVYVYDNNSIDDTVKIAAKAGAIMRLETRQGKGHVVRRMFADIEADIYVLIDGDGTYHAPSASIMVEELQHRQLDMIVAVRRSLFPQHAYRLGHQFGNLLFNKMVGILFGNHFTDILSGYRVMSRRFVKSFPALAKGFEIEAQLTIHALELSLPSAEVESPYYPRAEGTSSKLRTCHDGLHILFAIVLLFKEARPFAFFGFWAFVAAGLSLGFGVPIVIEFAHTGLVPRFPTAILAAAFGLVATVLFSAGLVLDTVSRGQRELKRLNYLRLSSYQNLDRQTLKKNVFEY